MVRILAHRGAHGTLRENTLAAFAAAWTLGVDGVELDARRTADDQLVVHHDPVVDGLGPLAEATFDRVRSVAPWVPTVAEALDVSVGRLVNVELKNRSGEPDWDPRHRAADLLVACLGARGGRDDVIVSSFDLATVDRVLSGAPHLKTALLVGRGFGLLDAVRIVDDRGHGALHAPVGSLTGSCVADVVEAAHRCGVEVAAWTVNRTAAMRRLAAAGVDTVITDDPARACRVLA